MSGGGYFGNKYFPEGFFPEGYFGTTGEADPNAMFGSAAGLATVTGLLTNGAVGFIIGLAEGFATVTGDLTFTGEAEEQVGGAQFGPIHRLRRKKRKDERKKRTLRDAIEEAFEDLERQALRAKAATVKQATQTVDDEALIAAAGDAAYKAAYEAAMAKALAEEQAEADRIAAKLDQSRTALQAAFAKAERERAEREAKAVAEALEAALAKAEQEAEAAYQRFLELKAQNDDDEEAAMALIMALEAA